MDELINMLKENGIPVVSSREIALNFSKRHDHVLRSIEAEILEIDLPNSGEISTDYFIPSEYLDTYGRPQKEYLITFEGFAYVVMGFTGQKAGKWKRQYIQRFKSMEKYLRNKEPRVPIKNFKGILGLETITAEDYMQLVPRHLSLNEGRSWLYKNLYLGWEKAYDRDMQKEAARLLNTKLNQAMLESGTSED